MRSVPAPAPRSAFCILPSAFCILLLTSCATTPTSLSIDSLIDRPPHHRAVWGVLIEDDDGRVLYSRNADRLMIPASNRKLFAAAAIADCLGFDARLATELWLDGDDVVIRGGGDPTLGANRYARDDDFTRLALALRDRGIARVRDVVVDVSLFDRDTIPGSWKHGNLGYDYGAPVDAISWRENEVPVDRSVADPARHAGEALRNELVLAGIRVEGEVRVNTEARAWQERVAVLQSPFVAHMLTTVLKNSHNLYTEMLLKRISADLPASYGATLERERRFLTSAGIEGDAFRFMDGSGLSPDDLVTPSAIVAMLRWMNDPARRGIWWTLLAQPAGEGTLRRRNVELETRFRGKTGTLNGVSALSGVVAMPNGRYRYVSVVANHFATDSDEVENTLDAVVAAASRH